MCSESRWDGATGSGTGWNFKAVTSAAKNKGPQLLAGSQGPFDNSTPPQEAQDV
jgi:hypothetical protein